MYRLPIILFFPVQSASAAWAEEVKTLYRAQTIVTGIQEPERTRGFRAGLTDVVVKLTGDSRLADRPQLKPLLERPHPLVEKFEYEDRMKDIPIHDEQGTRERPFYLRMQFKPDAIDKALLGLGLRQWDADRPLLAVWLGVKTAVKSYVLTRGDGDGYGQRAVLMETSERRGVPIFLPEDTIHDVGFDDIAGQRIETLRAASPAAASWLSGVLSINESGYWNMSWRLDWKGQTRSWTLKNVSFDTAIKDGLQTAARIFSGHEPM